MSVNNHPHQCNKHHCHNEDSIPLLPLQIPHKQDISYYHLNIYQNQTKQANDNSNNLL